MQEVPKVRPVGSVLEEVGRLLGTGGQEWAVLVFSVDVAKRRDVGIASSSVYRLLLRRSNARKWPRMRHKSQVGHADPGQLPNTVLACVLVKARMFEMRVLEQKRKRQR